MASRAFTDQDKEQVYTEQLGECGDCHKPLYGFWHKGGYYDKPKQTFSILKGHIHHIIAIILGGKHKRENWILLCLKCHTLRHTFITNIWHKSNWDNSKTIGVLEEYYARSSY